MRFEIAVEQSFGLCDPIRPLLHRRHDPRVAEQDAHPFHLDSRKPTLPFKKFALEEARFAMLARSDPTVAERLFAQAQRDIDERWHYYEQLAGVERHPLDEKPESKA